MIVEQDPGRARQISVARAGTNFRKPLTTMRQVPLGCDTNIAVNGCSGFANSTQKEPFMAMLTSCSRGTYLIQVESATVAIMK